MHRGNQWLLPLGHLLSFWQKQLAANAHDETSRSVIITPIFGLENVNKCPTFSETKQKSCLCERGFKTSNPRSEYNKRNSINCHKYNQNKLYFIHRISIAWAFSFRNNVATMLQRRAILQSKKTDVSFQIGSFFLYKSFMQSLIETVTLLYSNSSQSFPNWAPHAAVFYPQ